MISAANVHDIRRVVPLLDRLRIVNPRTKEGFPVRIYLDKAYASEPLKELLRWFGIRPYIPEKGKPEPSSLGKYRYVIEQTFAALKQFRRLKIRYEKRSDIHQAFLTFACAMICFNRLQSWFC
jgi:transposase